MFEIDKEKIGNYLKNRIEEKYGSQRQFAEKYLEKTNPEYEGDALRNMCNRLSQIVGGKKNIQISDLPAFSELLEVPFEEILSGGEIAAPTGVHMTNYQVAYSKDPAVWEKYVEHEDKLILNYDEYGKTVLDYIFEFKNYGFLKYLLDEKLIWFVDENSEAGILNFGAGTSIKRRASNEKDWGLDQDLFRRHELRTNAIALAIENGAYDILDAFHARECACLNYLTMSRVSTNDFTAEKNEKLIRSIAYAPEKVISYFAEEFEFSDLIGEKREYIYPYLGDVIDLMLNEKRYYEVEILLQAARHHNQKVYWRLKEMLKEACEAEKALIYHGNAVPNEILMKDNSSSFIFSKAQDVVFFENRFTMQRENFISNLIQVKGESKAYNLKSIYEEVNDWRERVIKLARGIIEDDF